MNSSKLTGRWSVWSPYLLSVLRMISAFLFMQYGATKLFGYPATNITGGRTAPLASLLGIAGALETAGGALLLVGLFTRPVAFLLSGEMAVAYFTGHAGQGFWPVLNGGVPAILFAFVWIYISAVGAGPWSIDALRSHRAGAASTVIA